MTLIGAILKKVISNNNVKETNRYISPPPELVDSVLLSKKRKLRKSKYAHIKAFVDSSPPQLDRNRMLRNIPKWVRYCQDIYYDNAIIVMRIAEAYMRGGKIDSRLDHRPEIHNMRKQHNDNVKQNFKRIMRENKELYRRLLSTRTRVIPTANLEKNWEANKKEIVYMSSKKFVLFPVTPQDIMEDPAFAAPEGVIRPKVYMTLRMDNASTLGTLRIELFTDVCPDTCKLFLDLFGGDGVGFSYVGTQFFRKVPNLFWSGGDVVYNNGFGCYAQRGRARPILAENYHFSHSMPGLLSMRVSSEGDVCGIFNITFKALPQFDLRNVVFGRILRPSLTYDAIYSLGSPLSTQPIIEIISTKLKIGKHWCKGLRNTQLKKQWHGFMKQ